jgi:hypothetical protein
MLYGTPRNRTRQSRTCWMATLGMGRCTSTATKLSRYAGREGSSQSSMSAALTPACQAARLGTRPPRVYYTGGPDVAESEPHYSSSGPCCDRFGGAQSRGLSLVEGQDNRGGLLPGSGEMAAASR